ncbi:MAG: hypothetical protein JXR94_08550, partial [Candidatus Hydrogenedentes bacterium]|nr:hypothetical protein [Candidatus Hydrogenedentota bacterium]
ILYGDEVASWRRIAGHSVARDDIAGLVSKAPGILVIGTGAMGVMKVPDDTRRFIEDAGIALVIEPTGQAVKSFNALLEQGADVAIAMHLTC